MGGTPQWQEARSHAARQGSERCRCSHQKGPCRSPPGLGRLLAAVHKDEHLVLARGLHDLQASSGMGCTCSELPTSGHPYGCSFPSSYAPAHDHVLWTAACRSSSLGKAYPSTGSLPTPAPATLPWCSRSRSSAGSAAAASSQSRQCTAGPAGRACTQQRGGAVVRQTQEQQTWMTACMPTRCC